MKNKNKKIGFLPKTCKLIFVLGFMCILSTGFPATLGTYAQTKKITLSLTDKPINEIFQHIEKNSEYIFLYSENVLDDSQRKTIHIDNQPISDILDELFTDMPVDYQINNRQIILKQLVKPIQQSPVSQEEEKKIVTGVVKDISGETIIGATVIEKGNTTNGVITDFNGKFSLKVASGATITVSYIGFKTKEVIATGQSLLSIVIEEDMQALGEVVVVGYGSQKKENLTGAVSQVKMEAVLGDRPVTSITTALQGAVPGLNISGGSTPGASKSINIRGTTSINGGSPLILIDNVPGDIDMINPEDIESVTTLKDAASASIYGARGAFGVILITTKKAKKNTKLSINYTNSFGFQKPMGNIEQPDMLKILEVMQERDVDDTYYAGQNYELWKGYIKDHRSGELMEKYPDAHFDNGRFLVPGDKSYYYLEPTNPQQSIYDNYGFQQKHDISASGGSENITYRMSLGYTEQDGPLQTDKDAFNRLSVSSYVNADITDWMSTSIDVRYAKSNRSFVDHSQIWVTNYPIWYPDGEMPLSSNLDGPMYPTMTPLNYLLTSEPKVFETENPRIFSRTLFNPIEGLEIALEYTYDKKNSSESLNKRDNLMINESQSLINMNQIASYKISKSGTAYNSLNAYATYQIDLMDKHNFKVMAGYNQDTRDYESTWAERKGLINPDMPSISGGTGELTGGDAYSQYSIRSGFFRLNYDYDGKYLFEINGRYDGSSKFPKDSRFGFFPSFSLGWNLAKEDFMSSTRDWIYEIKPRVSWGQLGNQAIDAYSFHPQMKSELTNWLVNGVKPQSLSMPGLISGDFSWETVETLDIGLDFSFFNNQLSGVFDWYQRDTKGMLAPGAEIPQTGGTTAPLQNIADLRTRGWEFAIQWRQSMEKWRYNVGFNVYDSRSVITKYDNAEGQFGGSRYREGMELGEIWGYVSDGYYSIEDFDRSQAVLGQWVLNEGVTSIEGTNVRPGDVKFKNINDSDGKNTIDAGVNTLANPGDRKIIGNNKGRYKFGMNGSIGWKNFDFSLMLQGTGKRDLWYSGDLRFPMTSDFGTVYSHQLDYWSPISTDPNSPDFYKPKNENPEFARIYNGNPLTGSNNRTQTQYLLDASYLRLKNITLSYRIPKETINKIGFQSAKVFFSGENIATFTSLPEGLDPERDSWGYPFFATYSFGLSISL